MKAITLRYFLAIIMLIFIPKLVFAEGFEYRGFKQGMSVSEAEAHANSLGGKLTKSKFHGGYDYTANNDPKNPLKLNFCNNEKGLYNVSYSVDGGFFKYVKIIEYFKKNSLKKKKLNVYFKSTKKQSCTSRARSLKSILRFLRCCSVGSMAMASSSKFALCDSAIIWARTSPSWGHSMNSFVTLLYTDTARSF